MKKYNKQQRKDIIGALQAMQSRGEFDNVPEHYFDFNKVEDEDLQYYNENWLEYPTISVGDTVEVNEECDMEELIGKQGIVSEIHYLGTPEHDTDNMEDDFIVETTDGDILIFMEEELTLLTK